MTDFPPPLPIYPAASPYPPTAPAPSTPAGPGYQRGGPGDYSFQPSPLRGIVRALLIIGLVLALPQALIGLQSMVKLTGPAQRQLSQSSSSSGGGSSRTYYSYGSSRNSPYGNSSTPYPYTRDLALGGLVVCADLALIVGAIMGLAGARAGRAVVLSAVAVLGAVELLSLLLDWFTPSAGYSYRYGVGSISYPYGRYGPLSGLKEWSVFLNVVLGLLRRLLYPVICFIVLVRRAAAPA